MENVDVVNPIHPDVFPQLDPQFVELYNKNLAHIPPLRQAPDLAKVRKVYSTQYSSATASSPECAEEYDDEVDGWERYPGKVKIRVYKPRDTPSTQGWPVHIDFHAGGWASGDLETEVHIVRHICTRASVVVVDVDYRLVPEYSFPTAIYDGFAVLKTVYQSPAFALKHNIDPARISLGGYGAGASIALVLNHLARDYNPSPIPMTAVIAGSPSIADISSLSSPEGSMFPSMTETANAPLLNWTRLKWFDKLRSSSLLTPETVWTEVFDQQEKDLSWFRDLTKAPNFEDMANLTYLATSGCDPLRDEGKAYGSLLEKEGNRVVIRRFRGVPHMFPHVDAVLPQAQDFISDVCKYIREAHQGLPASS